MASTIRDLPGHQFAPGFEPSAWDAFFGVFTGSGLAFEAMAALFVALCAAFVMASRVSTRKARRKRRTPLFPSTEVSIQGGPSLQQQGQRKKKGTKLEQLDERAKYFWDA